MNVRQLRHFLAVADLLHFGRAAERLGMTQPPLSQSIIALERELGTALFHRTKRSVGLTPFASLWIEKVRAAVGQVDALAGEAARLLEGSAGQLSLSFVSTADYSLLPMLVRTYAAAFPNVEISLAEATTDLQIPALLKGEVQAGIIIPPADMGGITELCYRPLLREPLVAAVPDLWIHDGRMAVIEGQLDLAAMLSAPLIHFPRVVAPAFHDLVTNYFVSHGTSARVVQQAIQMQTIISLVSAGMGIALVPASLRSLSREGVAYLEVPSAPVLETGLAWRRDEERPTLRHFLEVVDEVSSDRQSLQLSSK